MLMYYYLFIQNFNSLFFQILNSKSLNLVLKLNFRNTARAFLQKLHFCEQNINRIDAKNQLDIGWIKISAGNENQKYKNILIYLSASEIERERKYNPTTLLFTFSHGSMSILSFCIPAVCRINTFDIKFFSVRLFVSKFLP